MLEYFTLVCFFLLYILQEPILISPLPVARGHKRHIIGLVGRLPGVSFVAALLC